jgi:heptaprenyl diphosphate synthase
MKQKTNEMSKTGMVRITDGMSKTERLVVVALFFAVTLIIAVVESSLPPLPGTIPGVKFGFSNIAVMYVLFFVGKKEAYAVAIMKAVFVFSTRGFVAATLSLTGGLLSITVMVLLLLIFKDKVSYLVLSIGGAVFHNIGQLVAVSLIYTNFYLLYYFPVLLVAGVIAGIATATLLRIIMPVFQRLRLNNK